jgi:adenylate cyclase
LLAVIINAMQSVAPSLQLAWQLAAAEALNTGHKMIEPGHLLIGICKLHRKDTPDFETPNAAGSRFTYSIGEAKTLDELLAQFKIDRVKLYRAVRRLLGKGPCLDKSPRRISRSLKTKAVFEQAEAMAGTSGEATALHLFRVLLEDSRSELASVLKTEGIDLEALKSATLGAALLSANNARKDLPEPIVSIPERLDATTATFEVDPAGTSVLGGKLGLLYELPIRFANENQIDELLQQIVARVVEVISQATRGALLLIDRESNALVLKAHIPVGEPGVSVTLAQRALDRREGFIWTESDAEDIPSAAFRAIGTGMYMPLIWQNSALGVVCVDTKDKSAAFSTEDLKLLAAVAAYSAMAVTHLRTLDDLRSHRDLTNRLFTSRFAPRTREHLLQAASNGSLPIGTRKSTVTVLTSDIRGFAQLTRQLGGQETSDLLNEYFPLLVEAIHDHQGTVERFVGDGIFAVFGSPEADEQQQLNAVRAAVAMQAKSADLMQRRIKKRQHHCEMGIGIECGEALHGFVGNASRLDYAVIGNPANLASRYCSAAGGGDILISAEVHGHVFRSYKCEPISFVTKDKQNLHGFKILSAIGHS